MTSISAAMPSASDLKVLLFNPQFSPILGGAERQTERLAVALAQRGADVVVVTLHLEPSSPRFERLIAGARVVRIPYLNLNGRFPRIRRAGFGVATLALTLARTYLTVRRLAADRDVVHLFNLSTPVSVAAAVAAAGRKVPVLARPVNMGRWFDLAVLEQHPIVGSFSKRTLMANVSGWHAISDGIVAELRRAGISASRIRRVPNGVEVGGAPAPLPALARKFLYLGRVSGTSPRDYFGLVRTFDRVAAECTTIELAVVGGGDQLEELRRVVATLKTRDRIRIVGSASARGWLTDCDCLVMPSFVEGMSNALLEAMAAGKACIAYDVSANREVLAGGEAGILVPTGDHEALFRALNAVANVPSTAARLGAAARRRAAQVYDIESVASLTADVYRELSFGNIADLEENRNR